MSPLIPNPRVSAPTAYGHDLLKGLPRGLFERPIVHTQPEPWALVQKLFPADKTQLHLVTTMEHRQVAERTERLGPASAVFGIGGGSAVDSAKYVAWKKGLPLVLLPSILSVDAAFCKSIAVREGGRVRYLGAVFPDHFLIDFGILQAAPVVLNRGGIGDVLSIFTALWDWREAHQRLGEFYDAGIAQEARALLDRLFAGVADLTAINEKGLRLLAELYVGEVILCERVGCSRPEEGSEHYIAYCTEALTQRPYIHGQLVGLGVLLAGRAQGQEVRPVREFLDALDLDCSLKAMHLTRDELFTSLTRLPTYLKEEQQLLPGVFHFLPAFSPADANALIDASPELKA